MKYFLLERIITAFAITVICLPAKSADARKQSGGATTQKQTIIKDIPQGPMKNLLIKVGPGGISKDELDFYYLRFANKAGKTPDTLSPEEKKKAGEEGINDETLFQAALAEGAFNDNYIQSLIISQYKSSETNSKIDPKSFTEAELEAHYKAHPEEFSEPATNHLKSLKLDGTQQDNEKKIKLAKTKPDSIQEWSDLGWMDKEKFTSMGFYPAVAEKLIKIKTGQCSEPIDFMRGTPKLLFYSVEAKESTPIPYEQAKGKVKFSLVSQKQKELTSGLMQKLAQTYKGASEDELLLRAGLASGCQRYISTRQYVINWFLAKKKATREQLLPELKKKYPASTVSPAK
ncbi:MAG: hypothetical protein A2X49_06420 [Lentisphaerae bacterium GWF2_52_8]|nr:MAG: hypothetical protein A2X49_06420 [Lentisphaerae bacterium GWF2_52_8]